ncbi:MAG: hypothetical protein COT74_06125 [Bdellovibrionales bacterium CG10_big_fil_rev_8_21_14_0_10_45_34]|nr:MAG: hypothetical protein COT74_06125 [Bdellovibrionales bacterium CG10_big_fil_rev_8_21_14_0_10_45_34]
MGFRIIFTTFATFATLAAGSASASERISGVSVKQKVYVNHMPGAEPGGMVVGPAEVTFSAYTSGCTNLEDFTVEIKEVQSVQFVTIKRLRLDVCNQSPQLEQFTLRAEKLDTKKPIQFTNPMAVEQIYENTY